MAKTNLLLIVLVLSLFVVCGFAQAKVFMENRFVNSTLACSQLGVYNLTNSYTKLFDCYGIKNVMNLRLRNTFITFPNYSNIVANNSMYNIDTTYTAIFQWDTASLGVDWDDLAMSFAPYLSQASPDSLIDFTYFSGGYGNFSPPSMFSGGFSFSFGSGNCYTYHLYKFSYYGKYGLAGTFHNSYPSCSPSSVNPCINNFCTLQMFYNGTGDHKMKYYINNISIANVTITYNASEQSTLNNVYSSGVFALGQATSTGNPNKYIFNFLKLETGNAIGNYTWNTANEEANISINGTYIGNTTYDQPECNDTIDNDGDGFIDYPADQSCSSSSDDSELPFDASTCSEKVCSQADFCVFYTDFSCLDSIYYHSWASNPDFYGILIKPANHGILLNEYLDNTASYPLSNGTYVNTQSHYTISTGFSANKKDYTQVEHNFVFYFDKDHYGTDNVTQWVNLTLVGEDGGSAIKVAIHPVPQLVGNDVDLYMYVNGTLYTTTAFADGNGRFELQIRTTMPDFYHPTAYYDFFYRSPRFSSNYSWLYSNAQYNFLTSDSYINSLTIGVSGDPANVYAQHNANVYMYLQKIDVKGLYDANANPTQCTTYTSPYILKEDFQGCLEQCGWATTPSSICMTGDLIVGITDSVGISKITTPLSKTQSRYVALQFNIEPIASNYGGGLSIQVYDDTPQNFIYLLVSDSSGTPVIYNQVNGNYLPIVVLSYGITTNIKIVIDFGTNTFSVYVNNVLISSDNEFVNTFQAIDNIYALSLISSNYGFSLDTLSMYTTDQTGNPSTINLNNPPSVIQNSNLSMCGYVNKNPINCVSDSDCSFGVCQPNGRCSTFDYTYCDRNGMTRGNGCFMSAMTTCSLTKLKDFAFANLLLILLFLIILMVITYFAVMMRKGNGG